MRQFLAADLAHEHCRRLPQIVEHGASGWPRTEARCRIDAAQTPGVDELTTPEAGPECRLAQAHVRVVAAGDDRSWEPERLLGSSQARRRLSGSNGATSRAPSMRSAQSNAARTAA